jgi:hypothetical protein
MTSSNYYYCKIATFLENRGCIKNKEDSELCAMLQSAILEENDGDLTLGQRTSGNHDSLSSVYWSHPGY